jgi:hypothetical protein
VAEKPLKKSPFQKLGTDDKLILLIWHRHVFRLLINSAGLGLCRMKKFCEPWATHSGYITANFRVRHLTSAEE